MRNAVLMRPPSAVQLRTTVSGGDQTGVTPPLTCFSLIRPREAALCVAVILVSWPTLSLAYVDPTGGGLLAQILMGGLAGVIVVSRLWIRRFMGGLIRLFRST